MVRAWRDAAGRGAVLWTEPVLRTIYLGQVNLVLLALIMWDLCQPDTNGTLKEGVHRGARQCGIRRGQLAEGGGDRRLQGLAFGGGDRVP